MSTMKGAQLMPNIISRRRQVEVVTYSLYFENNDCPGSGYSFECDEHGNPAPIEHEAGRENLKACVEGTHDVTFMGIIKNEHSYVEPAVLKCTCGGEVELIGLTN